MSAGQTRLTCLPRSLDVHHCASVSHSTLIRYRTALQSFVTFLSAGGHNPSSAAELDLLVIGFKQQNSLTCSALELLIASLEFHIPALKAQLAYTKRALKGLAREKGIKHTVPLCSGPAKLFAIHLAAAGHYRIAFGLVLQTLTGLRPSELLGLRERHILRPTVDCPRFIFRLGVGTGTKVQREQTTYLEWSRDVEVSKLLWRLVHCTHDSDFLFPLSYAQYRALLAQVGEHLQLGVRFTPHSPRAGFATEESVRGVGVASIRERGRWASEQSFKIYLDIVSASQIEASFALRGATTSLEFATQHFSSFFGRGVFGSVSHGLSSGGGDRRRRDSRATPIGAEGGRHSSAKTTQASAYHSASQGKSSGHATKETGWFQFASKLFFKP